MARACAPPRSSRSRACPREGGGLRYRQQARADFAPAEAGGRKDRNVMLSPLIDPGSEWRLHRLWFEQSAMADLLGADYALVEKNGLYRCLDRLLEHKTALFDHLRERWQDLFGASFEVLLYDLTSTYFESAP